jgi:hypothetical protein
LNKAVKATQKASADEFADCALDSILGLELDRAVVERPRDLGRRELVGVLVDEECQDSTLGLYILSSGARTITLGAIRRVGVSHREYTLLVVRRPVVCKHFGSPLLGAGSQLPFPLQPAW